MRVESPGSIANLGPGFDVVAAAVEGLKDVVLIRAREGEGKTIVISEDPSAPSMAENNAHAVVEAARSIFPALRGLDVEVRVKKGVPVGAGLGSSGATAAAVALGLARLLGVDDESIVLELAGAGEAFVAGAPHYDNVAASLKGGVAIVDLVHKRAHKLELKRDIHIAVVSPGPGAAGKKTMAMRGVLPPVIDTPTHVLQSSALATLIYSVVVGDVKLFGRAASVDYVAEPHRQRSIPFYREMRELAFREGAYGFNICGAGPSVFVVHESQDEAARIGGALADFLLERGVEARVYATRFTNDGARAEVMG